MAPLYTPGRRHRLSHARYAGCVVAASGRCSASVAALSIKWDGRHVELASITGAGVMGMRGMDARCGITFLLAVVAEVGVRAAALW